MHIRLLGTGAAEGWPALFCGCDHCRRARVAGGRNIRTRASAVVDGAFQFDFGPDAYAQALAGHDLSAVRQLVFTHSHADHLAPGDLGKRRPPFAHGLQGPLHVWGNDRVLEAIRGYFGGDPPGLELHALHAFEAVHLDDALLTPLLADHDPRETCLIHLFEHGGRRLLYAHDSGVFPEATWEFLGKWAQGGGRLDAVLLDCTNGPLPGLRNHLGLEGDALVRDRLLELGLVGTGTPVVATHFSHNGGLLHDELATRAEAVGLQAAYDGMELEV